MRFLAVFPSGTRMNNQAGSVAVRSMPAKNSLAQSLTGRSRTADQNAARATGSWASKVTLWSRTPGTLGGVPRAAPSPGDAPRAVVGSASRASPDSP